MPKETVGSEESRVGAVVPLCSGTFKLCNTQGRRENQGGGGRRCTPE